MRKSIYVLCFIVFTFLINAKLINTNPDPNGEPWYAGGVSLLTLELEQEKFMDAIPVLTLPENYKNRKAELPYTLDNSLLPYFRPVFCQEGGSCSQASGIAYTYTYEQNFIKGTSANITDNQYPTHYTYNFLNYGSGDNGSGVAMGWDIVSRGGCPNVTEYGGLLWPSTDPLTMHKLWMGGYDKYTSGMENNIIEQLSIPVGTPEGLETLKQWLNDHCDGSDAGGLAVFYAGIYYTFQKDILPANSYCPGESVVLKWDKNVNHAMTFVGYNDSIRWDYNKDGKYTNNIDINGDGKIDMQDWEIGAVRMVNSWGTSWADGGKAWVMYRTLAQHYTEGGIFLNTTYSIKSKEAYQSKFKMKTTINYNERNDIRIMAGISNDINAVEPDFTIQYPHFNYQGGDSIGMAGDGDVLEIGFDITELFNSAIPGDEAKIFLCVEQKRSDSGRGRGNIETFSITDDEGTEFVSDQTFVEIINDSITYATVTIPKALKITTTALPAIIPEIGYSHTLTAIKGLPPYSWETLINYTEIENNNSYPAETMTKLKMSNTDDGYAIVDLDFEFQFFDELYSSITVTTNGAITFNNSYEDVKTLSDIQSTKTIAPCAAEFKLSKENGIYYYANEEYIIINWKVTVPTTSGSGSSGSGSSIGSYDFTAKLDSDGKIEFFYGFFTQWVYRVAGISNGSPESTFISKYSNVYHQSYLRTSFSSPPPYPFGLELSNDGILSGILEPTDVTDWKIMFKVTDSNGLSAFKELLLAVADPTAVLAAPLNPLIIKNIPSSILSWDQVPGATIYNIYRSAEPYSGFIQIGTSTSLSYEDNNLLPGNKYFYFITANNSK